MIILGLIIVIYPKASEMYYNYQQEKIMEEWEKSLLNIDTAEAIKDDISEQYEEDAFNDSMDGLLKIEKIGLKLPVLKGATHGNLLTSLASIKGTGLPGQIGNYGIAGHRNKTYGRNFNRLEEMEIGDTMEFKDANNNYEYVVTEKLYVRPEEVWVLKGNDKDKEMTLVTCHPMNNPTQRLVIKGVMIEDIEKEED